MGHAELTAHALITLGTAEMRLGQLDAASGHYVESLGIQKELGDRRNIAIATINLAVVFLEQKRRFSDAHRYFNDAASMFLELGDVNCVASALEGLAALSAECGNHADAVRAYGSAAAIREGAGMPAMPDEERMIQQVIAEARLRLGEERTAGIFAEGRTMTIDAAVEWALREIHSTAG